MTNIPDSTGFSCIATEFLNKRLKIGATGLRLIRSEQLQNEKNQGSGS
ncbi:hypothetical protein [Burkholderia glumae]|nr:hypothetical protein [Burkholderia glumae]MCQ0029231.1 hypothetical protein [Burkholderia glumae]MCQ0036877.1 hypothetical protein [Burkholderia glumae]QJW79645.1 hypothetical protein GAS18_13405 [Burkholderia glumae]